jgi:hypothetical protein
MQAAVGKIASKLDVVEEGDSPLQIAMNQLGVYIIVGVMVLLAVLALVIGLTHQYDLAKYDNNRCVIAALPLHSLGCELILLFYLTGVSPFYSRLLQFPPCVCQQR